MTDLSTPMPEALTHFNCKTYEELHQYSLDHPEKFWGTLAKTRLTWMKPFTKVMDCDMTKPSFKWFYDGELNVSVQCVDRHLPTRAEQTAIIFEQDKPGTEIRVSYAELHKMVNQISKVLKNNEVKKGDRVTLYMPMSPIAVASMLACARIGAMHSVVFTGFSAEALASRIKDANSAVVLTADSCHRGGRTIQCKKVVDAAIKLLEKGGDDQKDIVKAVLVYKRTGDEVNWDDKLDKDLLKLMEDLGDDWHVEPERMNAEDPLFLLYTSGSTGKPKGIMHTQAGYLLFAMLTTKHVYDLQEGDIYSCVADIGWITGHTYVVYGPLANGSTTVVFESTPLYPDAGRYWEMVQRLKITQFYGAPTAIRLLLGQGDEYVTKYDRSSLRVLGSVGEPINLEAWKWYHEVVGDKKCDVVDTWWQTETGGNMLTPRPAAKNSHIEPAIAMRPFFGIKPEIITTDQKNVTEDYPCEGALCISKCWPGQARSIFEDHERFKNVYYDPFPGYYFSGDGCIRTEKGYYKITGRMDDVINVSGHRMSTAEIEAVLTEHEHVGEAAVVGYPHDIKGEAPYAYVILKEGAKNIENIETELKLLVRTRIAAFSVPNKWLIVTGLPKTRSGKIMRRILRKIASDRFDELGDVSTLAEPAVVGEIVEAHKAKNKQT